MTEGQFDVQLDRIRKVFGKNNYPVMKTSLIWAGWKDFPYEAFCWACDELIKCSRRAPTPKDFLDLIKHVADQKTVFSLGEVKPFSAADCKDCGDSGFIRLVRNETFEEWAKYAHGSAPCHCMRGQELIEAGKRMRPKAHDFGPQYNSDWEKSYSKVSPWPNL